MIILVETTVSIVTIRVGVKKDIHPSILKLSLEKTPFRYPGAILFNSLPETYKRAASLEAFKRLLMKHDFA